MKIYKFQVITIILMAMVIAFLLCAVIGHKKEIDRVNKNHNEALLKQKLAKPTPEWITQHGDGLQSVEIFNVATLVELERQRQAVVVK